MRCRIRWFELMRVGWLWVVGVSCVSRGLCRGRGRGVTDELPSGLLLAGGGFGGGRRSDRPDQSSLSVSEGPVLTMVMGTFTVVGVTDSILCCDDGRLAAVGGRAGLEVRPPRGWSTTRCSLKAPELSRGTIVRQQTPAGRIRDAQE